MARSLGLGQGTVSGYLSRARTTGRRFFSLADLNAAIRALLDDLNDRSMITIWWSSGRPESASRGWLAPSATRPCMGLPMSRCSCGPPDTILWTEGSLPLGAITRAVTLYSVGPVRGPDP